LVCTVGVELSLNRLEGCERRRCWMFQRFHEMKERRESGFTLIELLVVILIIAILAAIAIPVFLNQRKKGWTSQAQSSLKNAATALETYATDTNGSYVGADPWTHANLTAYGYSNTSNVTLVINATANDYCIISTHALIPTTDAWYIATYDSDEGEPQSADTC
jgi:type IV pilus assembly protein PilA